jgi:hypothetical protein
MTSLFYRANPSEEGSYSVSPEDRNKIRLGRNEFRDRPHTTTHDTESLEHSRRSDLPNLPARGNVFQGRVPQLLHKQLALSRQRVLRSGPRTHAIFGRTLERDGDVAVSRAGSLQHEGNLRGDTSSMGLMKEDRSLENPLFEELYIWSVFGSMVQRSFRLPLKTRSCLV